METRSLKKKRRIVTIQANDGRDPITANTMNVAYQEIFRKIRRAVNMNGTHKITIITKPNETPIKKTTAKKTATKKTTAKK